MTLETVPENEEKAPTNGQNGDADTSTDRVADKSSTVLSADDGNVSNDDSTGGNVDEIDGGEFDVDDSEAIVAPTTNSSLHEADLVKKRLEEVDPCEKLRALCKKGEVDELKAFLADKDKTGVDIDYVSSDGWTCLHEIITHGCQFTDVARALLEHGAKVNTTDFNEDTPLHASLLYHNTDNVKLLLEYGADTEMANAIGRHPIHNANDAETLELLLKHGASIDAKDMNGNTALHYVVMAKDTDRLKMLIDNKCDVNAANGSGSTPLHLASDPEITRMLVDAKADTNAVDNGGNTPLHVAVRGRHKETARVLVEQNAKSDLSNANGKSPIGLAKDKEMRNILNGVSTPTSAPPVKKPGTYRCDRVVELPGNPELKSPSILKRKASNNNKERTGPRLRFSEVNDYSGVEEDLAPMEKRVRASPMYTEPEFSSDEDV